MKSKDDIEQLIALVPRSDSFTFRKCPCNNKECGVFEIILFDPFGDPIAVSGLDASMLLQMATVAATYGNPAAN